MLSDEDIKFLNRCTTAIGSKNKVPKHRFTEEDIQTYLNQLGLSTGDLGQPWKTYFDGHDTSFCVRCKAIERDCDCVSPELVDQYYTLNPQTLLDEWAETLSDRDWFDVLTTENLDQLNWRVKAKSDSIGEFEFRVFMDGQQFSNYSPNRLKKKFPVSFTNHDIVEDTFQFFWSETLDHEFWQDFHNALISFEDPLSYQICTTTGPAFTARAEEIEDAIFDYFAEKYEEPGEVQKVCSTINDYINIDAALFAVEDDSGNYIVLCNCDADPDHLHFHYYDGNELRSAKDVNSIRKARDDIRGQVKEYNRYAEGRQDLQPIVRAVIPVLLIVNVGPLVQFIYSNNLGLTTLQEYFAIGAIILINIVLFSGTIIYLILPAIKIRRFKWKITDVER